VVEVDVILADAAVPELKAEWTLLGIKQKSLTNGIVFDSTVLLFKAAIVILDAFAPIAGAEMMLGMECPCNIGLSEPTAAAVLPKSLAGCGF